MVDSPEGTQFSIAKSPLSTQLFNKSSAALSRRMLRPETPMQTANTRLPPQGGRMDGGTLGVPHLWMIYNGKSKSLMFFMDDLGVPFWESSKYCLKHLRVGYMKMCVILRLSHSLKDTVIY